jgi:hypothetical protein
MTTTDMTEEGAGGPDGARRRGSRSRWLVAALVVVAVAAASVAVMVRHDGGTGHESISAQQIAAIERGCAQWHRSYTGVSTPPANWCSAMAVDDWGYPIVDPRPVPEQFRAHAKRAVAACPTLALRLDDDHTSR